MERKRYIVTISQDYLKNWIKPDVKLDYDSAFFENKISYTDIRYLKNIIMGYFRCVILFYTIFYPAKPL